MPPKDNNFGIRLPRNPVAPSDPPMPNDDTTEILRILRAAETRNAEVITRGDLENAVATTGANVRKMGETFLEQLRHIDTKVAAVDAKVEVAISRLDVHDKILARRPNLSPMPRMYSEKPPELSEKANERWDEMQAALQEHSEQLAELAEKEAKAVADKRTAQEAEGAVKAYVIKLENKRADLIKILAALIPLIIAVSAAIGHYLAPAVQAPVPVPALSH
jgi:DNA repair ATPase RecN